jgi:hypothetical protein
MADARGRAVAYRLVKARRLLECFGVSCHDVKADSGGLYMSCSVKVAGDLIRFKFPMNRLGYRFIRELERLDRLCFEGSVNPEDVRILFATLSVPEVIYKHRSRLRRATGLIKDPKLQRWIIWRRITSPLRMEKSKIKGGV